MSDKADQSDALRAAIVDDDASLCRALGRLLTAVGIQPTVYHSAEAFLSDSPQPEPDCLVLDVQLEGMSGIELQQQLAATGRKIPVVFITAHFEPGVQELAERGGCVAFLSKSDPGQKVIAAVRQAIRPVPAPTLQTAA